VNVGLLVLGHWPFWLGGVALAAVSLATWLVHRRPLGVSGTLQRALRFREERAADRDEAALADRDAFRAALLEATLAEFGPAAPPPRPGDETAAAAPSVEPAPSPGPTRTRTRWGLNVTLLAGLALGGLLAAAARGGLHARASLGADFERLWGSGGTGLAVLLLGGLLTGLGTGMAGGCTAGHGLDGCARLQRGSLVATAVFFGTAIAVSLLLERVRG
jgi:uncharacterized protein